MLPKRMVKSAEKITAAERDPLTSDAVRLDAHLAPI
jgi:hypothetical protein